MQQAVCPLWSFTSAAFFSVAASTAAAGFRGILTCSLFPLDGCSGSDSQLSQTAASGAERTGQGVAQNILTGLKHWLVSRNVYFSRSVV